MRLFWARQQQASPVVLGWISHLLPARSSRNIPQRRWTLELNSLTTCFQWRLQSEDHVTRLRMLEAEFPTLNIDNYPVLSSDPQSINSTVKMQKPSLKPSAETAQGTPTEVRDVIRAFNVEPVYSRTAGSYSRRRSWSPTAKPRSSRRSSCRRDPVMIAL